VSYRFQFSLRSLLIWATLFAACCALLGSFKDSHETVVQWTLAALSAFIAWLPGQWAGRFLGTIGRHALAWFFAVAGGMSAFFLLLNENVPDAFQDAVLANSLIHGTIIASIIELIAITSDVMEFLYAQPLSPDSPDVLMSVSDESEAAIIVAALSSQGLRAFLTGDFRCGMHALAAGQIRIMVRHKDLDQAKAVLNEHKAIQESVPSSN